MKSQISSDERKSIRPRLYSRHTVLPNEREFVLLLNTNTHAAFCNISSAAYSWWLFSHSVMSDSLHLYWTAAHQAPLSTGFPRQVCWSGLPFPSPHILGTLYLTQSLSCSLCNSSCSFSYQVTKYTNSTFFFFK